MDIFDLDSLIAQLILAVGAALLIGNGYALIMTRRGVRPAKAQGDLRKGRAWWLMIVGGLITVWALVSLVTG